MAREFSKIGVIGLGTMGAGIVEVFAREGFAVVGVEPTEESLERGRGHLQHSTDRAVKRGKLTAEAERRLDIQLAPAEKKPIAGARRLPGEALIPPGRSITVTAPVAGLISLPPSSSTAPIAGQRVEREAALLRLLPGEARNKCEMMRPGKVSQCKAF